jgi:nucleoside-diphosphate-sugar epimerase
MRVLVTGHLGYIGPHVVELLVEAGHFVRGVDLNWYEDSAFSPLTPATESVVGDVFALTEADLDGFDAVIHLAGVSNDPIGTFAPELTRQINLEGTLHLARVAKAAGVPRFLFSSSCSIYGKADDRMMTEDDPVVPVTVYGETKIESERRLARLASSSFSPTYLRNATAYGASPRLRLDLVLNNLCAWAFATKEIRVISDGTPWRPLVHCRDIARAFVHMSTAPREKVHDQAFNVGCTDENYRVKDLVDLIREALPEARAVFTGEGSPDSRDYQVDFSKLALTLPDLALGHSVRDGIAELLAEYSRFGMTEAMIRGPRFIRLAALRERLVTPGQLAARPSR